MWLISFFPAKHLCIDNYIAVKNYLLSFGVKKLEQTGNVYVENGEKFKSRKKTSNKWFETQDSISYWDVFDRPKIAYRQVSNAMDACIIPPGIMLNDKCYIIVGDKLDFLLAFLNSRLFSKIYFSRTNFGGGKGKDFLNDVKLIFPDDKIYENFRNIYKNNQLDINIENFFLDLFELSEQEKDYIRIS